MTPEQNAHVKTLTTREEIFDYVESHLKNQGRRSGLQLPGRTVFIDGAYRGEGGTMCAVGCLLADDEYDPGMENLSVEIVSLPERLLPHTRMLADLQSFHDRVWNWSSDGTGPLSSRGTSRLRDLRSRWLGAPSPSSDSPDSN
jgi:hypothetical protein